MASTTADPESLLPFAAPGGTLERVVAYEAFEFDWIEGERFGLLDGCFTVLRDLDPPDLYRVSLVRDADGALWQLTQSRDDANATLGRLRSEAQADWVARDPTAPRDDRAAIVLSTLEQPPVVVVAHWVDLVDDD